MLGHLQFGKMTIILLSFILATSGCIPTSNVGGVAYVEAIPIPARHVKCQTEVECQPGLHCLSNGYCGHCIQCKTLFRHGQCVKDAAECGDCLDGYETDGYYCLKKENNEDFGLPANGSIPAKILGESNDAQDGQQGSNVATILLFLAIGLVLVVVVVVVLLILGMCKRRTEVEKIRRRIRRRVPHRRARLSLSEEQGSGNAGPDDPGPGPPVPTAPLLPEYEKQPAYNMKTVAEAMENKDPMAQFCSSTLLRVLGNQIRVPQRSTAYNAMALPYQRGNGAGDWERVMVEPLAAPVNPNPNNNEEGEGQEMDQEDGQEDNEVPQVVPEEGNEVEAVAAILGEQDQQLNLNEDDDMPVDVDAISFEMDFRVGLGYSTSTPQQPNYFDMSASYLELNEAFPGLINSQASSSSTIGFSNQDSGTGSAMGEESDSGNPNQVPDQDQDNIRQVPVLQLGADVSMYNDDGGDDEDEAIDDDDFEVDDDEEFAAQEE